MDKYNVVVSYRSAPRTYTKSVYANDEKDANKIVRLMMTDEFVEGTATIDHVNVTLVRESVESKF